MTQQPGPAGDLRPPGAASPGGSALPSRPRRGAHKSWQRPGPRSPPRRAAPGRRTEGAGARPAAGQPRSGPRRGEPGGQAGAGALLSAPHRRGLRPRARSAPGRAGKRGWGPGFASLPSLAFPSRPSGLRPFRSLILRARSGRPRSPARQPPSRDGGGETREGARSSPQAEGPPCVLCLGPWLCFFLKLSYKESGGGGE